jgi:excisionase family DNA binding protein
MSERERMMKILAANPATLAKIDAVLSGMDGGAAKADDDVRLCTFTEAARRLNISRPTVYRLVKLGRLETVPLDGTNRIRLKSVVDFANGANG